MPQAQSYKNLIVWQKSMEVVSFVYSLTRKFPREEIFGITSQMRRSAVSIPSNIAEGSRRGSRKDYRNFMLIAYGSGAELETQLEISKREKFANLEACLKIENLLDEVMRMLNKIVHELEA
ncbi:MAG: four helix bundle protein [Candidatus Vogelbacteria bacterium]|nr:four helix bundle protein [Candidatus Vogelbacteria bacterium]